MRVYHFSITEPNWVLWNHCDERFRKRAELHRLRVFPSALSFGLGWVFGADNSLVSTCQFKVLRHARELYDYSGSFKFLTRAAQGASSRMTTSYFKSIKAVRVSLRAVSVISPFWDELLLAPASGWGSNVSVCSCLDKNVSIIICPLFLWSIGWKPPNTVQINTNKERQKQRL